MASDEHEIEVILPEYDVETLRAIQFLSMQEGNATMQECADFFGLKSRQTLYTWINKWEASGTMEKARQIVFMPRIEKIKASYSKIAERWPRIVNGIADIAENPKMPGTTRLMAAAWLEQIVIRPELDKQIAPGATERAYAESEAEFNPSVVRLPAALKKKLNVG